MFLAKKPATWRERAVDVVDIDVVAAKLTATRRFGGAGLETRDQRGRANFKAKAGLGW
jgi:hypothetical protein